MSERTMSVTASGSVMVKSGSCDRNWSHMLTTVSLESGLASFTSSYQ